MPSPSAPRGAEVRRRLLDAAVRAIPEQGWRGVSTRSLARRAGVVPGLVHYHFDSLEALLREAALGALREELAQGAASLRAAPSLAEGVQLMLGYLDRYSGSDPLSLLFAETYLAATRDDGLRRELAALLADFRGALVEWLSRGGTPAAAATAATLAAALDGLLLHRALDPGLDAATVAPALQRLVDGHDTSDRKEP